MQENYDVPSDLSNGLPEHIDNSLTNEIVQHDDVNAEDGQEFESGLEKEQQTDDEHSETTEAAPVVNKEPLVLRKQKKQLLEKNRRLEDEIHHLRQQVFHNNPSSHVDNNELVDPATGQPIDEDSVQGQVLKALNSIAQKQKKDEVIKLRQKEQAEYQAALAELQNNLESGYEKYDDFDEVVMADNVPFTESMRDIAAVMIPNPDDVLYAIAKDRNELSRISKLQPRQQAREMVKLSGLLLNKRQDNKPAHPVRNIKPINNNPVKTPTREITDRSSVSDIRRRLKNNWK